MNNKKGFTLIELLTVIVILGILVLIASPSFLGAKEKAELALIKTDVHIVEKEVGVHLLKFDVLGKTENSNGFKKLSADFNVEGTVYDKEGIFDGDIGSGGELYNVSNLIDSTLNKEGFFAANNQGKAFYIHQVIKSEDEVVDEDESKFSETPQEDFTWVENSNIFYSYDFPGKQKGYWKYTGNDKEVVIPTYFEGEKLNNYGGMFESNSSVMKVSSNNPDVISTAGMFYNSTVLEIDMSDFKGENVISTEGMFWKSKAEKISLLNFNPKNVKDMVAMFRETDTEEILLGPKFKGENVNTTNAMFYKSKAKKIDLSNFNPKNVENMAGMFRETEAEEIFLDPNFKGENVTSTNSMFNGANAKKIDLSNFNPKNVETMSGMFRDTEAEEIILGPNFKGENVTSTSGMFWNSKAEYINLSNFNPEKTTTTNAMFYGSKFKKIDLSKFNPKNVEDMSSMFRDTEAEEIILGPYFKGESVTSTNRMFDGAKAKKIDLSNFNPKNVENMSGMFSDTEAEEIILGPNFKGENVTTTGGMFWNSKAEYIDLSNFNPEKTTTTNGMFYTSKAKKINLSKFNPKNVEDMGGMFRDSDAEEIVLGPSFKGENVTSTNSMFMNSKVKKIDLSNFNPKNVKEMVAMFRDSEAEEIVLGPNFKGENVTTTNAMFMNSKVKKIDLSSFNPKNVTDVGSMFRDSEAEEIVLDPNFKGEHIAVASSMFRASKAKSLDLSNIDFDRRDQSNKNAVNISFIFSESTPKTVYVNSASMKFFKSYPSANHINFIAK